MKQINSAGLLVNSKVGRREARDTYNCTRDKVDQDPLKPLKEFI